MALDYILNNTGPEVQERLDQVPVTQAQLTDEIDDREAADAAETQAREAADAALQDSIGAEATRAEGAEQALDGRISAVEGKVPQDATPQNPLADKDWVAGSIATATADFITASVNDLVNYYLKSETYTKAEVQHIVDAVKQFNYQSVPELPTASAATTGIIYLVPSADPQSGNVKDEYITVYQTNEMGVTYYSWEQIGSTAIDLADYYTKSQTDAAITADLNTALASYSTTAQMNTAIETAIANLDLSDTYETKGAAAAVVGDAGADYNTLAKIQGKLEPIEGEVGDKPYEAGSGKGLGRKNLPLNSIGNKNLLSQSMINQANTVYVIQNDYEIGSDGSVNLNGDPISVTIGGVNYYCKEVLLNAGETILLTTTGSAKIIINDGGSWVLYQYNYYTAQSNTTIRLGAVPTSQTSVINYIKTGGSITIPANCTLKFDGGSISGGTLQGNNTKIEAGIEKIFLTDIILSGTWDVDEAYVEWFGAKGDGVTDDYLAIKKCIDSFDNISLLGKKYYVDCSGIAQLFYIKNEKNGASDISKSIYGAKDGVFYRASNATTLLFDNIYYKDGSVTVSSSSGTVSVNGVSYSFVEETFTVPRSAISIKTEDAVILYEYNNEWKIASDVYVTNDSTENVRFAVKTSSISQPVQIDYSVDAALFVVDNMCFAVNNIIFKNVDENRRGTCIWHVRMYDHGPRFSWRHNRGLWMDACGFFHFGVAVDAWSFRNDIKRCSANYCGIGFRVTGVYINPTTTNTTTTNRLVSSSCNYCNIGFYMSSAIYSSFVNCGADYNELAYHFDNSYGISVNACGQEHNSRLFDFCKSTSISIDTCYLVVDRNGNVADAKNNIVLSHSDYILFKNTIFHLSGEFDDDKSAGVVPPLFTFSEDYLWYPKVQVILDYCQVVGGSGISSSWDYVENIIGEDGKSKAIVKNSKQKINTNVDNPSPEKYGLLNGTGSEVYNLQTSQVNYLINGKWVTPDGYSARSRQGFRDGRSKLLTVGNTGNDVGFPYFDTSLGRQLFWNGGYYKDADGHTAAKRRGTSAEIPLSRVSIQEGPTSTKPTNGKRIYVGYTYHDTTENNYQIANAIASDGTITWVNENTKKRNVPANVPRRGTIAERDAAITAEYAYNNLYVGFEYWNTVFNWPTYISTLERWGDGTAAKPYRYHIEWASRQYYTDCLSQNDVGFAYYNTDLGKNVYAKAVYGSITWIEEDGAKAGVRRTGTTVQRPGGSDIYVGFRYFDTDLQKPVYAAAIGSSYPYTVTWVDTDGNKADSRKLGLVTQRPALSDIVTGFAYIVTQDFTATIEDPISGEPGETVSCKAGVYTYILSIQSWATPMGSIIADSDFPSRS